MAIRDGDSREGAAAPIQGMQARMSSMRRPRVVTESGPTLSPRRLSSPRRRGWQRSRSSVAVARHQATTMLLDPNLMEEVALTSAVLVLAGGMLYLASDAAKQDDVPLNPAALGLLDVVSIITVLGSGIYMLIMVLLTVVLTQYLSRMAHQLAASKVTDRRQQYRVADHAQGKGKEDSSVPGARKPTGGAQWHTWEGIRRMKAADGSQPTAAFNQHAGVARYQLAALQPPDAGSVTTFPPVPGSANMRRAIVNSVYFCKRFTVSGYRARRPRVGEHRRPAVRRPGTTEEGKEKIMDLVRIRPSPPSPKVQDVRQAETREREAEERISGGVDEGR